MAVVAKIQRVSLLESQEVDGAVRRLVTRTTVVGLTDTTLAVLNSALAAAGIPAPGTTLVGFPELILRERNTKLVDQDKGTVDVDLVYEHLLSQGQSLTNPVTGASVVRASAKVQQIRTNKDIFGKTIELEHTYPDTDESKERRKEKFKQGGEVDFFRVMRSFTIAGNRTTTIPWLVANSIVGKINATAWSGGEIRTWLCVGASWELLKSAGASTKYDFEFEFQHNPDTWDPTAVFIDDRTGKPPVNLVQDKGFKVVRVLGETDFEAIVGGRIQGA